MTNAEFVGYDLRSAMISHGKELSADSCSQSHPAQSVRCEILTHDNATLPLTFGSIPQNCRFHVDDVNLAWALGGKFDFIHTRDMTPGIKDWQRYLQHVYK